MKKVFVTNVKQYTGPGVVKVLSQTGYKVICHDAGFSDPHEREAYNEKKNVITIESQSPADIVRELTHIGDITRFVFNDVHENTPKPFEEISLNELRLAQAALFEFPFLLSQQILPALKAQQTGSMVFITSARQLQPEPGFALATSIRAGSTALALSIAREAAPYGIQINAIQPNYLYSEMYYPKSKFVDDPVGKELIASTVPAGRLGNPDEFGQLVEFFISGRSPFTAGQVINFTGGWP